MSKTKELIERVAAGEDPSDVLEVSEKVDPEFLRLQGYLKAADGLGQKLRVEAGPSEKKVQVPLLAAAKHLKAASGELTKAIKAYQAIYHL